MSIKSLLGYERLRMETSVLGVFGNERRIQLSPSECRMSAGTEDLDDDKRQQLGGQIIAGNSGRIHGQIECTAPLLALHLRLNRAVVRVDLVKRLGVKLTKPTVGVHR